MLAHVLCLHMPFGIPIFVARHFMARSRIASYKQRRKFEYPPKPQVTGNFSTSPGWAVARDHTALVLMHFLYLPINGHTLVFDFHYTQDTFHSIPYAFHYSPYEFHYVPMLFIIYHLLNYLPHAYHHFLCFLLFIVCTE